MRRVMAAAILLMVVTACGETGSEAGAPTTTRATSTTTAEAGPIPYALVKLVYDAQIGDSSGLVRLTEKEGSPCVPMGSGALSFMELGTVVTIKSQTGEIIGQGTTSSGYVSDIETVSGGGFNYHCNWTIQLVDLPAATFYVVQAGGKDLATIPYDEMASAEPVAAFHLGN